MLLISNSGKTKEILELIQLSKNIHSSIPFIVITGNNSSPLAKMANVSIFTGGPDEICPLGLTPTTSTTTMTVIGDIMVTMMIKKTGFTAQDYAKRHHGGYLGDKSRNHNQSDTN
jgi:arabinose-5-phosphate isomerase